MGPLGRLGVWTPCAGAQTEPLTLPDDSLPPRDGTPVAPPSDLGAEPSPGAWRKVDKREVEPGAPAAGRGADKPGRRERLVSVGRIVGGVIGALVLLIVIFLMLFNWDWLRGPIGRYASKQMHREVRIDGHLRVHLLTWTPRVRIERLFIGQPDWAKAARKQPFATVDSVTVDVKLMPLFAGRIDVPLLDVERPNLSLYEDAKSRANWDFSDPNQKKSGKPFKLPPIRKFVIADGHLDVESVARKMRLTATMNSTERLQGGPAETFRLSGKGSINTAPFLLDLRGGPLINIRRDRPYPYDLDVRAADTHLVAHGQISKPFDFGHVVAHASITGHDLNDLYALTKLTLPNTPPYALSGDVTRDGHVIDIKNMAGRVGTSDLEGHVNVDTTNKRPYLKAQLRSRLLDFADLAAVFGAPGASKAATGAQKAELKTVTAGGAHLLPDATLQVDRIRAMDGDVTYHADSVKPAPNLPLKAVTIGAKLDDGLLKLNPITLTLPQGQLNGNAALNARGASPVTDVDVRLSNVQLENYIPAVGGTRPVDGTLAARARLHGVGNSVHKAAASSNGQVTVLIPHGHIRQAFAELMGIDATAGLFQLLRKDTHETELRCAVADFRVTNGVLRAQRITIDTDVVVVNGEGSINLGDETLGLQFKGKPTHFRLTRLNVPLTIAGRLNSPRFGIKPAGAVVQAGAAIGLGFLFPPLAIAPFLGLPTHNADCGEVTAAAERGAAAISTAQTHGPARRTASRRGR